MLTYRRDGAPQMSPIACNVDADGSHRGQHAGDRAQDQEPAARSARVAVRALERLLRDWIQVDGTAEVVSLPDAMEPLVDYYRTTARGAPRLGRLPRRHGARPARHRAHHPRARRSGPRRLSAAAAILAAGRGSRLGGDASKPLLEWRGRPLVAWAVDAALRVGSRTRCCSSSATGADEVRGRASSRPTTWWWSRTRTGRRGSRRACGPRSTRSTPLTDGRTPSASAWPTSRWSASEAYRLVVGGRRGDRGAALRGSTGQPGQAGA